MTTDEVVARLKGAVAREGSQAAWGKKHGVSTGYVSDVVQRRKEPGKRIIAALGLESFTIYRKRREG